MAPAGPEGAKSTAFAHNVRRLVHAVTVTARATMTVTVTVTVTVTITVIIEA